MLMHAFSVRISTMAVCRSDYVWMLVIVDCDSIETLVCQSLLFGCLLAVYDEEETKSTVSHGNS